jgi:hypothetical protein
MMDQTLFHELSGRNELRPDASLAIRLVSRPATIAEHSGPCRSGIDAVDGSSTGTRVP